MRKTRHRGTDRVGWVFTFTAAAYNPYRWSPGFPRTIRFERSGEESDPRFGWAEVIVARAPNWTWSDVRANGGPR